MTPSLIFFVGLAASSLLTLVIFVTFWQNRYRGDQTPFFFFIFLVLVGIASFNTLILISLNLPGSLS